MTQPENWRQREDKLQAEQKRSYRLILETTTLGVNLYEVLKHVRPASPRAHNFIGSSDYGMTGYTQFVASEHPKPYWRNVATGIWI